MSVYRDLRSMADSWERRARLREGDYDGAIREWASECGAFLRRMMSGAITRRQLRRLGHPFGRGSNPAQSGEGYRSVRGADRAKARRIIGRANVPPLPINVQSGRLRRSVYVRRAGPMDWRTGASAPYARYILSPVGTRRMVGRGLITGRNLPHRGPVGALERYARLTARTLRRMLTGR